MAAAIPNQRGVVLPYLPKKLIQEENKKEVTVTQLLGSGMFGEVYLLDDNRVIKLFKPGKEFTFPKEVKTHNEINKYVPAKFLLISVFFGTFQTSSRSIMGLIFENGGSDLLEIMTKKKQLLSDDWIKNAMIQILEGLKELKLRKILHSDIKPENLLFNTATNCLKIADFGAAKFFEEDGTVERLSYRAMCSSWYRSPECDIESKIGPSADLWSSGCVLFELLTLKPIFVQRGDCNQATAARALLLKQVLESIPTPCPIEKKNWPIYKEYDLLDFGTRFFDFDITPGKNQNWKIALVNHNPKWRHLLERIFQFSANRITAEDGLEFLQKAEDLTSEARDSIPDQPQKTAAISTHKRKLTPQQEAPGKRDKIQPAARPLNKLTINLLNTYQKINAEEHERRKAALQGDPQTAAVVLADHQKQQILGQNLHQISQEVPAEQLLDATTSGKSDN